MTFLASTAGDIAYYALAVFLVVVGIASAYMLIRLAQTFQQTTSLIEAVEEDVIPVAVKAGGTVDRVNYELDKLDTVTDSAVSMADKADTAVRAVSHAIATPVEKASGLAAGITHGFSRLRRSKDVGAAVREGKDAMARREQDLHDDLRNASRPEQTAARPEPAPTPEPWPKPEPVARPAPVPKPPPAPVPPEVQAQEATAAATDAPTAVAPPVAPAAVRPPATPAPQGTPSGASSSDSSDAA